MKATDIYSISDAERFISGCLTDFEQGLSTKRETMDAIAGYTIHVINLCNKAKSRIAQQTRMHNAIHGQTSPENYFKTIANEQRSKVPMP